MSGHFQLFQISLLCTANGKEKIPCKRGHIEGGLDGG